MAGRRLGIWAAAFTVVTMSVMGFSGSPPASALESDHSSVTGDLWIDSHYDEEVREFTYVARDATTPANAIVAKVHVQDTDDGQAVVTTTVLPNDLGIAPLEHVEKVVLQDLAVSCDSAGCDLAQVGHTSGSAAFCAGVGLVAGGIGTPLARLTAAAACGTFTGGTKALADDYCENDCGDPGSAGATLQWAQRLFADAPALVLKAARRGYCDAYLAATDPAPGDRVCVTPF